MLKICKICKCIDFIFWASGTIRGNLEEEVLMKHSTCDHVFHNTALTTLGQLKRNQGEQ